MNQQQNHPLEQTAAKAIRGLIYQIFALDSVVDKRKKCLARMEAS